MWKQMFVFPIEKNVSGRYKFVYCAAINSNNCLYFRLCSVYCPCSYVDFREQGDEKCRVHINYSQIGLEWWSRRRERFWHYNADWDRIVQGCRVLTHSFQRGQWVRQLMFRARVVDNVKLRFQQLWSAARHLTNGFSHVNDPSEGFIICLDREVDSFHITTQ